MLCCITPRYVVSENCYKEISLADLLRKPVVPVMVERTPWPPPGPLALILSRLIYIDLAGSGGHGGCGKTNDWETKMQEVTHRIRTFTSPIPSMKHLKAFEGEKAINISAEAGSGPPVVVSEPPAAASSEPEVLTEPGPTSDSQSNVQQDNEQTTTTCCSELGFLLCNLLWYLIMALTRSRHAPLHTELKW